MFRPVAKCILHLMNSQIDRETAQTVQFACIVFSTRRRECYSYDLLNRKKPNQLNSGDRDGYRTWSSFAFQLKQSVWECVGGGWGWLVVAVLSVRCDKPLRGNATGIRCVCA